MANLSFVPGDDFELTVTWTDPDANPINLTGYTASFKVELPGDDLELTLGDGITVDALAGELTIHIGHTETAEWDTDYGYRLRVTSAEDIVTTLMAGQLVMRYVIE